MDVTMPREDVKSGKCCSVTTEGLRGFIRRSFRTQPKTGQRDETTMEMMKSSPNLTLDDDTIKQSYKQENPVERSNSLISRPKRASVTRSRQNRRGSGFEVPSHQYGELYEDFLSVSSRNILKKQRTASLQGDAEMVMEMSSSEEYDPRKPWLKAPAPAVFCPVSRRSSQVSLGPFRRRSSCLSDVSITEEYCSAKYNPPKRLSTKGTVLSEQSHEEREAKMRFVGFENHRSSINQGRGTRRSSILSDISDDLMVRHAPYPRERSSGTMIGGCSGEDDASELTELAAARVALMAFAMSDEESDSFERFRSSFCS